MSRAKANKLKQQIDELTYQIYQIYSASKIDTSQLSNELNTRLNSLLVERAHLKKEFNRLSTRMSLLPSFIKSFSFMKDPHNTKRIKDFFK